MRRGGDKFSGLPFHGVIGCKENCQDVTCVIHDETLLNTKPEKT